jgi:hypothetical protein
MMMHQHRISAVGRAARRRPASENGKKSRSTCPPPRAILEQQQHQQQHQQQSPNARLAAAADQLADKYERLLSWAAGVDQGREAPRVAVVDDTAAGGGRGLVAACDVSEGDVLLSVPMSRVFCSEPQGMMLLQEEDDDEEGGGASLPPPPWALPMAARLLCLVRDAEARLDLGLPLDGWALWVAALPPRVVTPLEFSEREVDACGEGGAGRGVGAALVGMQQALRDGARRMRCRGGNNRGGNNGSSMPASLTDSDTDAHVLWAVQALSSRCFFEPALAAHLCVPGVDMANHCGSGSGSGGGPSARVEVRHSPEASQGVHVNDEYFDTSASAASAAAAAAGARAAGAGSNESEFRLVADRDLKRSEAVTISYGTWPAEVFFLLFGFVPLSEEEDEDDGAASPGGGGRRTPLEGDTLLLYEDARELADHLSRLLEEEEGRGGAWCRAADLLTEEEAASASRLACTLEGFDARLAGAVEALARRRRRPGGDGEGEDDQHHHPLLPTPAELVRARVAELLAGYAAAALEEEQSQDERLSLARAYAMAKAATGRAVLASMAEAPRPPLR